MDEHPSRLTSAGSTMRCEQPGVQVPLTHSHFRRGIMGNIPYLDALSMMLGRAHAMAKPQTVLGNKKCTNKKTFVLIRMCVQKSVFKQMRTQIV